MFGPKFTFEKSFSVDYCAQTFQLIRILACFIAAFTLEIPIELELVGLEAFMVFTMLN